MKLLKISFFVLLLSLFTKFLGLAREYSFVINFGSGEEMDAFVMASLIPIVVFSSLSSSFSMAAVKLMSIKDSYNNFVHPLVSISKRSLQISGLVLTSFSALYFIAYMLFESIDLNTFKLFLILSPSIVLFTLTGVLRGYLQVQGRFYISNLIGLPYNVLIILCIFLLNSKIGIYSAAVGSTLGVLGQLLLVYLFMKATDDKTQNNKEGPQKHKLKIKNLLLVVLPISVGGLILPVNFVVDRSLASFMETGAISLMNYAGNFLTIPFSLLLTSVFSVFFPLLNKLILKKKYLFIKKVILKISWVSVAVFIPLMICFCLIGEDVLQIIFNRGQFNSNDVIELTRLILFYLPSLLGLVFYEIISRIYYIEDKVIKVLELGFFIILLNTLVSSLLINILGDIAIPLGTSVSYLIVSIYHLYRLHKSIGFTKR